TVCRGRAGMPRSGYVQDERYAAGGQGCPGAAMFRMNGMPRRQGCRERSPGGRRDQSNLPTASKEEWMAQRTRLLGFLLGAALAGLAGWVSAARQRRKPLPL